MASKKIEKLNQKWQNEQKHYCYNKKFKTKETVKKFWDQESSDYDIRMFQDNRRVNALVELLKKKNLLSGKDILDVGCGTGLYALALAPWCTSVTAVDLSEKMGEVLLKKSQLKAINNIIFKECNWSETDIKKAGLYQSFDIALSALNPAINSAEAVKKLVDTAKEATCIVAFASRPQNDVKDYFENIFLVNKSEEEKNRRDGYYIYEILTEMGHLPEVSYVPMNWVKKHNRNEAIARMIQEYASLCPDLQKLKRIAKDYVDKNLDSFGMFKEYNKSKLAIIHTMLK